MQHRHGVSVFPARSAPAAIDERKRPRQSNFSSLSAGLIERGKVPTEILYGAEAAEPATAQPEAAAAPANRSSIIAEAAAKLAQAHRALQEERTRPRQTDFGSLSAGMMERGKLPRHILTEAEIDQLLTPHKVEPEQLPPTSGETKPEDCPDEQTHRSVVQDERDATPAVDVVQPASVAPSEISLPVGETASQIWSNQLEIIRPAAAGIADEVPFAARLKAPAIRPIAAWAASLVVAAIVSWGLLRATEPATDPAPAIAQIAESVAAEPPPAEAATAEPPTEIASAPAAEAPSDVDRAADEGSPDAVVVARRRPGAAPEEPAPAITRSAPQEPIATAPARSVATAALVQRGDDHLLNGDIAAARLFYERAAEAGDPQAMAALAQTYDPVLLRKVGARGVRPDPERAQRWYARAAEAMPQGAIPPQR